MKILVYDIETVKGISLISVLEPATGIFYDFRVDRLKNNLSAFDGFCEAHRDYIWIGYNSLRFDAQIVEFILRNYEKWEAWGWEEICHLIWQKATDTIHDANYDIFPEYRENQLSLKQMDLFSIWGYGNKNKMVSLKRLAFEMDMEDIEELPVPIGKVDLSDEEIESVIAYCHKDIIDTYEFYRITIGDTPHPLYKGKDKLRDRAIIEEETGLKCLNYDDVKIGAEWNKVDFIALTGRSEQSLKPKKVNYFYGKKYRQFFPDTVDFQTKELRNFVKEMGKTYVINKKQDFVYRFNDELTVTLGRGGIHSSEGARKIVPNSDENYIQCDIGSQYPNAARKFKVYPAHLGIEWNNMLTSKIERRLTYKQLAKDTKDPRYESLQEMGKLSLNGGAVGRLNTEGDWQEDPCCFLQVTIGCQLEILMIVEALVLKGFNVVSVNTDGFDALIKRDREQEFMELCKYYEAKIGNSELGNIEYTEFLWIVQTSVNDYIALKTNGEVKRKGSFTVDFTLDRNKSNRVVPIALGEYFLHNTPIVDSIKQHNNIYDFCIRQKASWCFHYEGVSTKNTNIYNKLIRYYVSNVGEKLYKVKNEDCTTNAPKISQVEAGGWLCTICNYLPKTTKVEDCNINYGFYVDEAEKIINKIDRNYKRDILIDKQQLTLW